MSWDKPAGSDERDRRDLAAWDEETHLSGSSCMYPRFAAQPMPEDALLTGALESTNEPLVTAGGGAALGNWNNWWPPPTRGDPMSLLRWICMSTS